MLTRAYIEGVRAAWEKLAGQGGLVDGPHADWFLEPLTRLDPRSVATGVGQGFSFNDTHFSDSGMTMPPAHVEGDHYRSGNGSFSNETAKSAYVRGKLAAVASVNPGTQSAASIKPTTGASATKPAAGPQPMKLPGAKIAPAPSGVQAQQVPGAPPPPSATNPASLLGQNVAMGQSAQTAASPMRLASPLPLPTTLAPPAIPNAMASPAMRPGAPPPSPGMQRLAGFNFGLTPRTNDDPIKADNNEHNVGNNFEPPHIYHNAISSAFDALKMPKNTDSVEAGGSMSQGPGI